MKGQALAADFMSLNVEVINHSNWINHNKQSSQLGITASHFLGWELDGDIHSRIAETSCVLYPGAETFGPLCKEAKDLILQLGRRLQSISGDPRCTIVFKKNEPSLDENSTVKHAW
ncbi:hypothetical protein C0J52_27316 [Blattella germanica]|nr:hypothetical protein C0J52_27316 [Blattella germanica]